MLLQIKPVSVYARLRSPQAKTLFSGGQKDKSINSYLGCKLNEFPMLEGSIPLMARS